MEITLILVLGAITLFLLDRLIPIRQPMPRVKLVCPEADLYVLDCPREAAEELLTGGGVCLAQCGNDYAFNRPNRKPEKERQPRTCGPRKVSP